MNKILNNAILASIFIVPMASMIPMHGTIIWYPQLLALMVIGFVCLAMLVWDMNKYISLFLIYGIFSYLIVCSQSPRSMLCLITGFIGIILSYFVSKMDTSKIYKALLGIAILNALLFIAQIFNHDFIFKEMGSTFIDRVVGFMGSRNQLGIFSVDVSILLSIISPWMLLFSIPILIIKGSTSLVGLVLGINSLFFLKGYRVVSIGILLGIILVSALWVNYGDKSLEIKERVKIWTLTLSQSISGKVIMDDEHTIIKANPLFGYGIGNFFVFSRNSQAKTLYPNVGMCYEHAHNDILEALFEFGYIGIGLLLLCVFKIVNDFITCLNKTKGVLITFSALIAMAVCSMGVYVFHAPVSLFMFCLTLGLFYGELNNAKQSQITTHPA